jgi:hypothetical protein
MFLCCVALLGCGPTSPPAVSRPSSSETTIHGDGVEVTLSSSWVGGAHFARLPRPPSDFAAQMLAGYSDAYTRLYAYHGDQVLAIARIETGRHLSVTAAGDLWASTFSENGYAEVSREPGTVDGHPAVRIVSTNPGGSQWLAVTSLEYVFPQGRAIWLVAWGTNPGDFSAVEPFFDTATRTIVIGSTES